MKGAAPGGEPAPLLDQIGAEEDDPGAGLDPVKGLLGELRSACDEVGRDFDSIEITAMWMGLAEGADSIAQYADLGVDRLVIPVPALGGDLMAGLDSLADQVLSKQ